MPNEVQGERWQRLRAGDVEVLLEIPSVGLPRVLHWGVDLGEVTDRELEQLALAAVPQVTSYVIDDPVPVAVLPEHALGWSGLPGVCGHRDDRSDWSPLFTIASVGREDYLRARPSHPVPERPRPALVNIWEAVYFDAGTSKLLKLADEAAALGIERFVLDDGWLRGRRSEQSGLGDWYVARRVHSVVADDGSEALYALVGLQTSVTQPPGAFRLPGLDDAGTYRLRLLDPGLVPTASRKLPPWPAAAPGGDPALELTGRMLATAGIQASFMQPESLLLLHLTRGVRQ